MVNDAGKYQHVLCEGSKTALFYARSKKRDASFSDRDDLRRGRKVRRMRRLLVKVDRQSEARTAAIRKREGKGNTRS